MVHQTSVTESAVLTSIVLKLDLKASRFQKNGIPEPAISETLLLFNRFSRTDRFCSYRLDKIDFSTVSVFGFSGV